MAYAFAIHNHTALQSLGDKTPWQMVHGYTPDISVFWSFLFWQPIRYFINGAKFPLNHNEKGGWELTLINTMIHNSNDHVSHTYNPMS